MSKCRGCYVLLLATLLAGVPSVISKSVCVGKSIPLFQNLTFGSLKTTVYLYKTSSDRRQLVAIWSNPKSDSSPIGHYRERLVFDDKGGNIFLEQFVRTDEATYVIKYDKNGENVTKDVEIVALVPPNETCRPKIKLESSTVLSAILEDKNCGKPLASVQWKDNPSISQKIKTVIKLHPGKEAGTYYACLDGPALECVNSTMKSDYCSNFTIEGKDVTGENHPKVCWSSHPNFTEKYFDNFPQVSDIVGPLHLLMKKTTSETVHTTVNMIVEQLKDVVVKPIVESNIKQLARLEEMYKKMLEEKQMVIDEKQRLINEKEVLLESKDSTIKTLELKMENLEASFDDIQQNGLGSSLRLNNVNLRKDESCEEKVVDVITNMANVSISRDDIDRCHPLGKPNKNGNRQLMIKFKSYKTKAKVFSQRKNMKGNGLGIYMIDDLTRPKPDLLNKLLKYKTSKRIETFWIVDGKIYARKYPGSYPKRINTMQDIEHLLINAESSLFANNEGKH